LKDKLKQLDMMSTIYSCATVTIIALTGKHANAGLPGIYEPRLTQVKENIDGYALFTSPQHITLEKQAALWSNRAWTMQEELLSRRSLTFTQSQVVFSCLVGQIEEQVDVATVPNDYLKGHHALSTFHEIYAPSSVKTPVGPCNGPH
jgi:hypothetical protein